LITGGGTGIGAAIARQLLERGHRVTITGRRDERLRELAGELGNPASLLTVSGDAADYGDVTAALQASVTGSGGWTRWWPTPGAAPPTASLTVIRPGGGTWC